MIPIRGWVNLSRGFHCNSGGSSEKKSVQILDRERLASLPGGQKKVDIVEWWLYWRGGKVVVKGGS